MSFAQVLSHRAFSAVLVSTAVWRVGTAMFEIAIVLLIVTELRAPAVAGAAVMLATFPGMVVSPWAGSLLRGRDARIWMMVDCVVKALAVLGIAVWGAGTAAGVVAILLLCTVYSLTSSVGHTLLRGYVAREVAANEQGRANGLDATVSAVVALAGPALAGVGAAALGERMTVAGLSALFALAALGMAVAPRVVLDTGQESTWSVVRSALRRVATHRVLRGLTSVYFFYQVTLGVLVVVLPLVVARLDLEPLWVGVSWSVAGALGIVSSLQAGRLVRDGSDRRMMLGGAAATGVAVLALISGDLQLSGLLAVFAVLGLAVGPVDVGMLTRRQRVLPEGGAMAVLATSSSLNMAGYPVGAFIGGLVAVNSGTSALLVAAACSLFAAGSAARLPYVTKGSSS